MPEITQKMMCLKSTPMRYLLIMLGTLFLIVGLIGIIIPILPTTPFLLLAAACYIRSSIRGYNWLMTNKWFGSYIKNYYEGRGIPLKIKLYTIFLLWSTILLSIIFFVSNIWVDILLLIIAIAVSLHLVFLKTYKPQI